MQKIGGGPAWPLYAGANSLAPFVAAAIGPVVTMLARTVFLTLVVAAAERLSSGWTRRRALVAVLITVAGGTLGTGASPQNLAAWIVSAVLIGLLLTALYVIVLRHDISIVPIAVAVMTTMGTLREGWSRAYPGALAGSIVASVLMCAIGYAWFRVLRESSDGARPLPDGAQAT